MQHAAEDQEGALWLLCMGACCARHALHEHALHESVPSGRRMCGHPMHALTHLQPLPIEQIAYVLGTEDFFHRRRKAKASADKAGRSAKFAAFIAKHAAPAAPAAAAPAAPVAVA